LILRFVNIVKLDEKIMLKNYFRTALRSLVKNRTTSFINLFGLSIGMTAAVFIFLWIQNEVAVDDYQPDHIYRLS